MRISCALSFSIIVVTTVPAAADQNLQTEIKNDVVLRALIDVAPVVPPLKRRDGRKPILREPVHVSLILEADTVEALEELAEGKDVLFSGYVRGVLSSHVVSKRRRSRRK